MFEFTYLAKDNNGDVVKGDVEAENDTAAAKLLAAKNLFPIDISIKEHKELFGSFLNRVSVKDKALFARQLATMINAGLPISQALNTLGEQSSNKKMKNIIETVVKDIEAGTQLSVSFSRFPKVFQQTDITLIATGEASGNLDKVLLRLADQIESKYKINKKIRSAFTYPAFILIVVAIVMAIMVIYVMPQMEGLYKSFNADLPFLTRMMIGLSNVLRDFGIFAVAGFAGVLVILRKYIGTTSGRRNWDLFKLKLPIIGDFLRKVYITRFSRTLSVLVSSGVPLLDSLDIVSKAVGNVVFEDIIKKSAEKVKGGIALSVPLKESEQFPLIVSQMISVGEKTGELDSMLDSLASYYEEEVDTMVKNFSTLLEPVILVVMGLVVGTLLVAIMMPIYGLSKVLF